MAYSPQQNEVAERKNMTIVEMAKCMKLQKKVVNTDVYLQNRCPTKDLNKKTPFEDHSEKKPGIRYLKVFRSLCYSHIQVKRDPSLRKQVICLFLGYGTC